MRWASPPGAGPSSGPCAAAPRHGSGNASTSTTAAKLLAVNISTVSRNIGNGERHVVEALALLEP